MNGGRQRKEWLSSTLRGTFLTQPFHPAVGGRRRTCWTSPTSCWRSLLVVTLSSSAYHGCVLDVVVVVARCTTGAFDGLRGFAPGTSRRTESRRLSSRWLCRHSSAWQVCEFFSLPSRLHRASLTSQGESSTQLIVMRPPELVSSAGRYSMMRVGHCSSMIAFTIVLWKMFASTSDSPRCMTPEVSIFANGTGVCHREGLRSARGFTAIRIHWNLFASIFWRP